MMQGKVGGTWLAMSRSGNIGVLTNIFTGGILDPEAKGRGFLVVDWLKMNSIVSGEEYLTTLR